MRIHTRTRAVLAALGASLALAGLGWAGGLDDFKLTKAIPADAFLVVHQRGHAGQAFLKEQEQRIWKAVENQHFERDLKRLVKGLTEAEGGDLEQFEALWQQMLDLLAGVEWSTLAEREFAFALKLEFPAAQFVLLMQPPADKIQSDFEGLGAILQTLVGFAPPGELVLTTEGEGTAAVHRLNFAQAPFPLGVCVARQKDTLVIGFGTTLVEQTLALLRGEPGGALAATARFQEAFKRLPPPTDGVFYCDISMALTQLRAFVDGIMQMVQAGGQAQIDPQWQALPNKIIDALDMFEYAASVATTKGMQTTSDSILVLRADAKTRPLYTGLLGNKPIAEPLKYMPKEAKDVGVWNGCDFAELYRAVVKFIADNVPGGADKIAAWNTQQEASEFNVERDVLAWIGGGMSSFAVPGRTPYGPGEFVLMLTVRDEAKAREMLGKLLETIETALAQQNGAVTDVQIEGAEGFRAIEHPMLLMIPGLARPTIGVKDGLIFFGSGPKPIQTALAVATGKAESFAQSERFKKEGLPPKLNVVALSFTDLSNFGEELGQILSMIPMIGMFGGQELMKNPVAKSVLPMLTKLGTVVREVNFLLSTCSQSTFDGKVLATATLTNYKEPPKPKTPAATQETESAGAATEKIGEK